MDDEENEDNEVTIDDEDLDTAEDGDISAYRAVFQVARSPPLAF